MIKDLRKTFQQTAIYGVSNVLIKATGLILLPIYTQAFTDVEYGALIMLEITTQFLVGIIAFNIPTAMLRIGSERDERRNQDKVYATALIMLLTASAIFLAISFPLRSVVSLLVLDSRDYAHYFTLLFISIAIEILTILPMQLLRLREEASKYLLFFAIKLLGLIGFVWYFVAYREMGVYGAILGILCANASLFLATLTFQLRLFSFHFNKKLGLEMIRYGAPLIFTTLAGLLLTIADRYIIKIYGTLADVGVYGLAYKIGSLSNLLIIGSFALGFLPIAFKKFRDPGFNRFFGKMATYFIGLTALLSLVISLFSKEIIELISDEDAGFWLAISLVPFIAMAFIFKALQLYFSYIFLLTKRTVYHAVVTLIGVVLNIGLNFLLIPLYDLYGAIAATAISYGAMAMITYIFAQRDYPIAYEGRRLALLFISCAALIYLGISANGQDLIWRLLIKSAVVILFLVFAYFGIADSVEREKVKKIASLLKAPGGIKALLSQIKP